MGVNVDAKDIATTIKSVPYKPICVFILIVDGVLLFAPENVITTLGLDQVREAIKPYLGIVFLCAAAILLISVVRDCVKRVISNLQYTGSKAKQRLDRLSEYGKQIVRGMYESESHTARLPVTDATVDFLQKLSIIGRPTISSRGEYSDHFLQPWVVEYLNKHPNYLKQMPAPDMDTFDGDY